MGDNWAQIAFFLTPLIALAGYVTKYIHERNTIVKVLKGELTQNAVSLLQSLPRQIEDGDVDLADVAEAIALNSRSFTFEMKEVYRAKFHVIDRRSVAQITTLYRNFNLIRREGESLLELLKIEQRSAREKKLVVRHCSTLLANAIKTADYVETLAGKLFFAPNGAKELNMARGEALRLHSQLKSATRDLT